jgi:hypothetical protein
LSAKSLPERGRCQLLLSEPLRPLGQHGIVWVLSFNDRGHLIAVEGASADALTDTVWRMVRLIAEDAAEGELISRPWGWFDAKPPAEAADRWQ